MKANVRKVLAGLVSLLSAAACSDSTSSPVPAILVVTPDTVTLARLDSIPLTVLVSDKDTNPITGANLTFASSDPAIVQVSSTGLIRSVGGIGPATVTVTAGPVSYPVAVNVFASVALPDAPYGVAASTTGVVYVAPILGPAVRRLNLSDFTLSDAVLVGGNPAQVQFNAAGTTAFVTKRASGLIGVVNVASHSQTDSIAVPGNPYPIRVSPDGATAFVTSTAGWLYKIAVASRSRVDSLLMPDPALQLAWGPGDSLLFVSSEGLGTVTEVRVATMAVVQTILVGGTPQGLAVSPNGSELYVADESGPLRIMSLVTGNQIGTVATGGSTFGVALAPNGATLYVGTTAGKILVVNRASRAILRVYDVGGTPRLIAVDPVTLDAVVPNEAADRIDIVR
jgi:DNA-binding beta-propeller fold protein YncE